MYLQMRAMRAHAVCHLPGELATLRPQVDFNKIDDKVHDEELRVRALGVPELLEELGECGQEGGEALGEDLWDDAPATNAEADDAQHDLDSQVLGALAALNPAYTARRAALDTLRTEEQRLAKHGFAQFPNKDNVLNWYRSKVLDSECVSNMNFNTLSKTVAHLCKGQLHASIFDQLPGAEKLRENVVMDMLHFGITVPSRMIKAICIATNVYVRKSQGGEPPRARTPEERANYTRDHLPAVKKSWKTKRRTCAPYALCCQLRG